MVIVGVQWDRTHADDGGRVGHVGQVVAGGRRLEQREQRRLVHREPDAHAERAAAHRLPMHIAPSTAYGLYWWSWGHNKWHTNMAKLVRKRNARAQPLLLHMVLASARLSGFGLAQGNCKRSNCSLLLKAACPRDPTWAENRKKEYLLPLSRSSCCNYIFSYSGKCHLSDRKPESAKWNHCNPRATNIASRVLRLLSDSPISYNPPIARSVANSLSAICLTAFQ